MTSGIRLPETAPRAVPRHQPTVDTEISPGYEKGLGGGHGKYLVGYAVGKHKPFSGGKIGGKSLGKGNSHERIADVYDGLGQDHFDKRSSRGDYQHARRLTRRGQIGQRNECGEKGRNAAFDGKYPESEGNRKITQKNRHAVPYSFKKHTALFQKQNSRSRRPNFAKRAARRKFNIYIIPNVPPKCNTVRPFFRRFYQI